MSLCRAGVGAPWWRRWSWPAWGLSRWAAASLEALGVQGRPYVTYPVAAPQAEILGWQVRYRVGAG